MSRIYSLLYRGLEDTAKEIRLQQRFRIIALFETQESIKSFISNALAILGVRQKMVFCQVKPASCLDHDCDHVPQHLL